MSDDDVIELEADGTFDLNWIPRSRRVAWICPRCTLGNGPEAAQCDVCEGPYVAPNPSVFSVGQGERVRAAQSAASVPAVPETPLADEDQNDNQDEGQDEGQVTNTDAAGDLKAKNLLLENRLAENLLRISILEEQQQIAKLPIMEDATSIALSPEDIKEAEATIKKEDKEVKEEEEEEEEEESEVVQEDQLTPDVIEALQRLRSGLEEHKAKIVSLKNEADNHFRSKSYEDAVNAYGACLKLAESSGLPVDAVILLNRSAAYLALKKYASACRDVTRSAKIDATNWKAHWRRGVALMAMPQRQFRTKYAIEAFEECMRCENLPLDKRSDVEKQCADAQSRLETQTQDQDQDQDDDQDEDEDRGATETGAGEARPQIKLKCPPDCDEETFYSLPEERQLEILVESKVCDVPFPKMGVTIQVFLDFIEENGGVEQFEGLTTGDVTDGNAGFVLKATQERRCSYCELLQYQKDPNVGIATVFISHACKQNFLQVVDALQNHFKDTPDVFVWFSSFSNNQHLTPNLPFEWFTGTFKSAIRDMGHTVMVLAPYNNPFPFTRAWCLFEIYSTVITESKFEVAMSEVERRNFVEDFSYDVDLFKNMIATIDVKKSEAWVKEDLDRILEVAKEVGLEELNLIVKEKIRDWASTTLHNHNRILSCDGTVRSSADALMAEAALLEQTGQYRASLDLYQQVLNIFISVHGSSKHSDVGLVCGRMGILFQTLGELDKAHEYLDKAIIIKRNEDETHPDIGKMYNSKGAVYGQQGEYGKAMEYYQKAISLSPPQGEADSSLGYIYENMAIMYSQQDDFKTALEYYEMALPIKLAQGETHIELGHFYMNIATTYSCLRKFDEAHEYLNKALPICRTMGETHESVGMIYATMGTTHSHQGEYATSLKYLQKALDIALLNGNNPRVQFIRMKIALSKERLNILEPLQEKLSIALSSDPQSTQTSNAYNNLGSKYRELDNDSKALECFNEALTISLPRGATHLSVGMAYGNMATVYFKEKDYQKAFEYFNKTLAIYGHFGPTHPYVKIATVAIDQMKKMPDAMAVIDASRARDGGDDEFEVVQEDQLTPDALQRLRQMSLEKEQEKEKNVTEMSIKELKLAIAKAGLQQHVLGFCEKSEFVALLLEYRAGNIEGSIAQQSSASSSDREPAPTFATHTACSCCSSCCSTGLFGSAPSAAPAAPAAPAVPETPLSVLVRVLLTEEDIYEYFRSNRQMLQQICMDRENWIEELSRNTGMMEMLLNYKVVVDLLNDSGKRQCIAEGMPDIPPDVAVVWTVLTVIVCQILQNDNQDEDQNDNQDEDQDEGQVTNEDAAGEARQQLKVTCPPGYDEEIFYSLPEELQLEVVAEAEAEAEAEAGAEVEADAGTTEAPDESELCDSPFPKPEAEDLEDPPDGMRYLSIGLEFSQNGEYAKAIEYYHKALAIMRTHPPGESNPHLGQIYMNMGDVYTKQKEYSKAMDCHQKELNIQLTLGNTHDLVGIAYGNIGGVYALQGEFRKAIEYYQKALAIFMLISPSHPFVEKADKQIEQLVLLINL